MCRSLVVCVLGAAFLLGWAIFIGLSIIGLDAYEKINLAAALSGLLVGAVGLIAAVSAIYADRGRDEDRNAREIRITRARVSAAIADQLTAQALTLAHVTVRSYEQLIAGMHSDGMTEAFCDVGHLKLQSSDINFGDLISSTQLERVWAFEAHEALIITRLRHNEGLLEHWRKTIAEADDEEVLREEFVRCLPGALDATVNTIVAAEVVIMSHPGDMRHELESLERIAQRLFQTFSADTAVPKPAIKQLEHLRRAGHERLAFV
jgi:hypothetical protein